MACFVGASNLEKKLGDFTDEIELANIDYVKELCALLAHAKAYELLPFKAWMVCVYRQLTCKTNTTSGGQMEQFAKKALA